MGNIRRYTILIFNQTKYANSAWPSLGGYEHRVLAVRAYSHCSKKGLQVRKSIAYVSYFSFMALYNYVLTLTITLQQGYCLGCLHADYCLLKMLAVNGVHPGILTELWHLRPAEQDLDPPDEISRSERTDNTTTLTSVFFEQ